MSLFVDREMIVTNTAILTALCRSPVSSCLSLRSEYFSLFWLPLMPAFRCFAQASDSALAERIQSLEAQVRTLAVSLTRPNSPERPPSVAGEGETHKKVETLELELETTKKVGIRPRRYTRS